ncbi:hypothetical protein DHEL01_v203538 [Diaporthe helianthi]|uniref:Uncharacterized protein n=1 Tax=Diaporthe helianthi TaxID=158607 RepID=A0A2P5I6C0_DIAHE|nr:hypothetical protein DHEL01_v203538 [Diaporthe helianthi]
MMPLIESWVQRMMLDYMNNMSGWITQYQREVVARPNAGLLALHKERVIDVSAVPKVIRGPVFSAYPALASSRSCG